VGPHAARNRKAESRMDRMVRFIDANYSRKPHADEESASDSPGADSVSANFLHFESYGSPTIFNLYNSAFFLSDKIEP
jgi:hypothetical protein